MHYQRIKEVVNNIIFNRKINAFFFLDSPSKVIQNLNSTSNQNTQSKLKRKR